MAKLLYVEDNEMNRDMLSRRLSRRGYEIIMAFDGQAGLDMMRSEAPDLVLMDMGLPVLDGWEATIQAKADESISSIPIIALTSPRIPNTSSTLFKISFSIEPPFIIAPIISSINLQGPDEYPLGTLFRICPISLTVLATPR